MIENLVWIFDSKIGKSILGLDIVMLAWSNGVVTIPLAIKVYQKNNKKSKIDFDVFKSELDIPDSEINKAFSLLEETLGYSDLREKSLRIINHADEYSKNVWDQSIIKQ